MAYSDMWLHSIFGVAQNEAKTSEAFPLGQVFSSCMSFIYIYMYVYKIYCKTFMYVGFQLKFKMENFWQCIIIIFYDGLIMWYDGAYCFSLNLKWFMCFIFYKIYVFDVVIWEQFKWFGSWTAISLELLFEFFNRFMGYSSRKLYFNGIILELLLEFLKADCAKDLKKKTFGQRIIILFRKWNIFITLFKN